MTKDEVMAVLNDVTNNILRPNGGAYVDQMEEALAAVAALYEERDALRARLTDLADGWRFGSTGVFEADEALEDCADALEAALPPVPEADK